MLLEQGIVMRNNTILAVQHRSKDSTPNGGSGQQALLLLSCLSQHCGLVPIGKSFLKVAFSFAKKPAGALFAKGIANEVGIAILQTLQHLGRITADLHAETDTQFVGKALR